MLVSEFLSGCIVLALPTVALVGVIGYAFVNPASILLIPLAVVLFGASATVVGYTFGFTYLHLSTRFRAIAQRNLSVVMQLLVLLLTGYVLLRAFVPAIDLPGLSGFTWLPIGWFVDLATLGTPVTASLVRAVAGLLGVPIVVVGGSVVVEQLATAYWYGDPTTPNQTTTADRRSSFPGTEMDPLAAAISPLVIPDVLSTPTQGVARVVLIRLRRTPRRLSLLIGIVVSFAGSLGIAAVQTENPLALVPIGCAVVLPWLVGATLGLNPLGDEGAVLPTTLTSSISGGQFVRGLMVPGLLYGLPLSVICTLVSNLFSPYSPVEQAGLVVFSAVLTVAAVTFAPAIGMAFHRFSAINVGQRGEAIPPSLVAVIVYSITIGIVSGIALITLFVPILRVNSVSPAMMRLGVFGVTLAVMVCFSYQAYRSAAKRFATHTIE